MVVRGSSGTEETPEAGEVRWSLLMISVLLRIKCVSVKEMKVDRLVPIRFERQRVNRGEWAEAEGGGGGSKMDCF